MIAADQYVLIIGAMKSGTSALFDLLAQHPQVCPAITKEPEFFSEHQRHGMPVERYEELWRFDAGRHRVALEASTGYSKFPDEPRVPQRIAEAGLQPRFIYVLRDPVARIESQVSYGTWGRRGAHVDFADPHAVWLSRYASQLDQYLPHFPRERFLLVDHSALLAEPSRVAAEVFAFLGLDPFEVAPAAELKNAARPRSEWERRLMADGRLARLAGAAPKPVKELLRRASGRKAGPRATMPPAVAEALRQELAPEMLRLQREWGFDVAGWGFVEGSVPVAS